MKPMARRALGTALVLALAACSGADHVQVRSDQPESAPATGSPGVVGDGEVQVSGAWVNGKGYIMKHRVRIVVTSDGGEQHIVEPLSPEDRAKIPAVDPALTRPITPAEQAAFTAVIEAEGAKYQRPSLAPPPNAVDPPPEPPPGPEQVYVPTAEQVAAHNNWTPPPIGEGVTVWEPPPGLR